MFLIGLAFIKFLSRRPQVEYENSRLNPGPPAEVDSVSFGLEKLCIASSSKLGFD